MSSFRSKVVLVTGGTSGIGRAAAIAFGKEEATVIVTGRRELEGGETLELVQKAGGNGIFLRLDVTLEAQVATTMREIISRYGKLDCAANCAGVDPNAALLDYTEADYDAIFDVNVKGLFFCLKHEISTMKNAGGAIVDVGSIAADMPAAGNSLYNASKSAARMLMRTAAAEAGKFGIRVNEVAPGPVATPMLEGFVRRATAGGTPVTAQSIAGASPMNRIGDPEEIAQAILFLCSARASFITGASLTVDGGYLLTA
jgi:NAD(P)-dependent dehydrogenase (short-subunit alcohol dehydrogenase family)